MWFLTYLIRNYPTSLSGSGTKKNGMASLEKSSTVWRGVRKLNPKTFQLKLTLKWGCQRCLEAEIWGHYGYGLLWRAWLVVGRGSAWHKGTGPICNKHWRPGVSHSAETEAGGLKWPWRRSLETDKFKEGTDRKKKELCVQRQHLWRQQWGEERKSDNIMKSESMMACAPKQRV